MLSLSLTAVLVTVLQFHRHTCASTPSGTSNLSLLDRLPHGAPGHRNNNHHHHYHHHHQLLLPLAQDDDLTTTTHLIDNDEFLADDRHHLLDMAGPRLFGAARRVVQDARLPERTHDPGSVLPRHHLPPVDTLHHLLPGGGNLVHQRGSSSSSSSRIQRGLGEEEEEEEKKEEEEELGDGTRLVLLYSLLPRSSDKRGRKWSWKPRGRRGKGVKGRWVDLGGKRQAVLDRMPLSYGRKRGQAWAAGSSWEGALPEREEEVKAAAAATAAAAFRGVPVFRGKRDGGVTAEASFE